MSDKDWFLALREKREEEVKAVVKENLFSKYDTTRILGDIDLCVALKSNHQGYLNFDQDDTFEEYVKQLNDGLISVLWAEAKKSSKQDICESFIQLVLTIGKSKLNEQYLPPRFLGAFDNEKIAFVQYSTIQHVFSKSDFNWNVTPSNHYTKEFKELYSLCSKELLENKTQFYYKDIDDLKKFINLNLPFDREDFCRIEITKSNFVAVYLKWLERVKPTIKINWNELKRTSSPNSRQLIDADFFLADLISRDNKTIRDGLYILLNDNHYDVKGETQKTVFGLETVPQVGFDDYQKAHKEFWNVYKRPPANEVIKYIVERRDLLVPQDIRERQGSFFTPLQWVNLSQDYLERILGANWQDEYYIWDNCAGTGNLLNGLTNKSHIWASTLEKADVAVINERISNGAQLYKNHVFQFDFLNDSFEKLPDGLKSIINDPDKRKKLIVYMNPPYGEAANKKQVAGTGEAKTSIAVDHLTYRKYLNEIGIAGRELFAQFLIRVKKEIPGCIIGVFSTLKTLQAPNFKQFRRAFGSKLLSLHLMPANTFDNVKGSFPIGFQIWDTSTDCDFKSIDAHVYDANAIHRCNKTVSCFDSIPNITEWIISTRNHPNEKNIGYLSAKGADFQNQNYIYVVNRKEQLPHPRGTMITDKNLLEIGVYFSVRKVIKKTWLNDRDQFLSPYSDWDKDVSFKSDCLIYLLFSNSNTIKRANGLNYFIPFSEEEVGIFEEYDNHFMIEYLKLLSFSVEALKVLNEAKNIYKYYHSQSNSFVNASFYDIREYFQGHDNKGKMNSSSEDKTYCELLNNFKDAYEILQEKIKPKVYEYGFLR